MIRMLRNNKELISYSLFSYMDKGLTFLLPLAVLYLFNDTATYNQTEYVYSVATLLLTGLELGIKGYYFYAYRTSTDRQALLKQVRGYFDVLLLAYLCVCLPLVGLAFWYQQLMLAALVGCRALYLMLTGFLSYHNRLQDQPFRLFFISFGLNIGSYLLFLTVFLSGAAFNGWYFFLPQLVVVTGYVISRRGAFGELASAGFWRYVGQALRFLWPSMVNVLIVQGVSNFGKVYAFRFLDADAMASISYVLRITLLVQLAHSACLEFLGKSMFTLDGAAQNRLLLQKYSAMMGFNILACLILIGISNVLIPYSHFPYLPAGSLLFIGYVVLWCYGAYFETFFNKYGRNLLLLQLSVVACGVFMLLIWLLPSLSLTNIGLAMTAYAGVYLLLQLISLKRLGLLQAN